VILGTAGRDFHNFNQVYCDDPGVQVVAFTQAQIPRLSDRRYPASLAGPRYPDAIPIEDEADLEAICRREGVDRVVFAYSRAAPGRRKPRVRGGGLRDDRPHGRARGRPDRVGRRQQRLPVPEAGSAHRHGRRAPARAGRRLPSRRGGAAHGGRSRHQQGRRSPGRQRAGRDRRGPRDQSAGHDRDRGLARSPG